MGTPFNNKRAEEQGKDRFGVINIVDTFFIDC